MRKSVPNKQGNISKFPVTVSGFLRIAQDGKHHPLLCDVLVNNKHSKLVQRTSIIIILIKLAYLVQVLEHLQTCHAG